LFSLAFWLEESSGVGGGKDSFSFPFPLGVGGGGICSLSLPFSVAVAIALISFDQPKAKMPGVGDGENGHELESLNILNSCQQPLKGGQSATAGLAATTRDHLFIPATQYLDASCMHCGRSFPHLA
jgi:hypothetical protein